jgi:hypothetical protein
MQLNYFEISLKAQINGVKWKFYRVSIKRGRDFGIFEEEA